jgi:hypothetical protein
MSTLSEVQQALINSQVSQQYWIDGGWEALSNQLEEELRKENEIISIFSLVDKVEPEIMIRVRITLHNWIYNVPLQDVSRVTDVNKVLHIEKEDLYPNWKERVIETVGFSRLVYEKGVIDHKRIGWSKAEYIDANKEVRVICQRLN